MFNFSHYSRVFSFLLFAFPYDMNMVLKFGLELLKSVLCIILAITTITITTIVVDRISRILMFFLHSLLFVYTHHFIEVSVVGKQCVLYRYNVF